MQSSNFENRMLEKLIIGPREGKAEIFFGRPRGQAGAEFRGKCGDGRARKRGRARDDAAACEATRGHGMLRKAMDTPPAAPSGAWNKNRERYEAPKVVSDYAARDRLFPAETAALESLGGRLAEMRMLDIGCGGGRTTLHFSGKAREYLGIDYSPAMIEGCRARFPHLAPCLRVGDARKLEGPGTFDFILFSHNGLDYISHSDRLAALREIRRACNPGARFLFSSHNLLGLGSLAGRGPAGLLKRALVNAAMTALNGNLFALRRGAHAVVRDEGCGFGLATYYVRPSEQLRQLAEAGFTRVRLLGGDGRWIPEDAPPDSLRDGDLHYLARAPE
jgi:SAM-dependent methyltransferase